MKARIEYEQIEKQKEANQLDVDVISEKESDDDKEDLSKPEKRGIV